MNDLDSYVTSIVDAWVTVTRGLQLAHTDYQRILRWQRQTIPLNLVLRTMKEYASLLRGPDGELVRQPRSLAKFERFLHKNFREYKQRMVGTETELTQAPEHASVSKQESQSAAPQSASQRIAEFIQKVKFEFELRGATALPDSESLRDRLQQAVTDVSSGAAEVGSAELARQWLDKLDQDLDELLLARIPEDVLRQLEKNGRREMARYSHDGVGETRFQQMLRNRVRQLARERYALRKLAFYAIFSGEAQHWRTA